MRYVIALIGAAIIIGGVALFIRQTPRSIEDLVRQRLRDEKRAGELPPELQGIDIESPDLRLPDMGMRLPRDVESRIQLAMLLSEYWFVWTPLVVAGCAGLAALTAPKRERGPT
jgi:hypothetical protein